MKALVFGITGQDGTFLSQHLIKKGYKVCGVARGGATDYFNNLKLLKVDQPENIEIVNFDVSDFYKVNELILSFKPTEIYNLSGQASVGLSYKQPFEAIDSIVNGTLNVLESIRNQNKQVRFYNAGSGEVFGDTRGEAVRENSDFNLKSPYAVAKASAYNLVKSYRETYGIFACTGLLFNHESNLRPVNYVTKKIVKAAHNISLGNSDSLVLGNTNIYRDWGWAPEYVESMWLMLQSEFPFDFIVSTGRSESLSYFIQKVFEWFNLDFNEYLIEDIKLFRPFDAPYNGGNPENIYKSLGWKAKIDIDGLIQKLCSAEAANKY